MRSLAIRPSRRRGAVLVGLVVVAAGCIGVGAPTSSPSGSAADSPAPSADSPSPSPSPSGTALPAALAAKTWVTLDPVGALGAAVAGTLDGRYHLTLPPDEAGLTAADFRVVSVRWTKAADGTIEGSTLIVRDLRQQGVEIARFTIPDEGIVDAVIRGNLAYLAGGARLSLISGVYEASLTDRALRTLIPPAAAPETGTGGGPARTGFAVSPSGRTLATAVCRSGSCTTQVLDLRTGQVRELPTNSAWPAWLSDTAVVVVDRSGLYGYDLSGRLGWAHTSVPIATGYVTSDGKRLVVQYEDIARGGSAISLVDLASGGERILQQWDRSQPWPWLWADVSSDDLAVLLPSGVGPGGPAFALEQGDGGFWADLLDLQTATVTRKAILVTAQ